MNSKFLLVGLALWSMSGLVLAERAERGSLEARANAQAEKVSDPAAFLQEVDQALTLAQRGEYGHLKRGAMTKLIEAQRLMHNLLEGRSRATELAPADRIALYNAQELITSTLRSDDKNRMICKRAPTTGSRLTKTECMTVAQREARARAGEDLVLKIQANICNPSETRLCTGPKN